MSYKHIGDYIRLVDKRNNDLAVTLLRGVSTTKQLIESVANMSGVSLHNYKVVAKRQFVYVSDTSRRGDKIGIALNTGGDCIVSSIYTVFESKDVNELLPEYLFMWFNRSEFDRFSHFIPGEVQEKHLIGLICVTLKSQSPTLRSNENLLHSTMV